MDRSRTAPRNLIGEPIVAGRGAVPGVIVIKPEEIDDMDRATNNGTYTLDGHRFRIRKGSLIPAGAVMDERAQPPAPETKAKPAAPQNKAKRPAPEAMGKDD